jgi:hypothetical protein
MVTSFRWQPGRWPLAVLATLLLAGQALAVGPSVTSKDAPPPGPKQAARWLEAILQASLLELCGPEVPRSEAVRMLAAVQKEQPLGSGIGWYDPSRRRHDWRWLAGRFDADRNGRITPTELAGPSAFFHRLDRDDDGAVTSEDLDWSERSTWVRREADALKLSRAIDGDGNGKLTEQEWQGYFKKLAGAKGYIAAEDLRAALAAPRGGKDKAKGRRVSTAKWLQCLMAGDLGSPFEGPRPGQPAPDFTLSTHDGKKQITLSDFHGKRPVVLIFGSFT